MTDSQRFAAQALFCLPGIILCIRMLRRVRERGGRVVATSFGWPDVMLASFLCGFFALSTIAAGMIPQDTATAEIHLPTKGALMFNVVLFLGFIGVIWTSLAWRKLRPATALGFRGLPIWRGLPSGVLIVAALFPVFAFVGQMIQIALPQVIKEQEVVTLFRATRHAGDQQMLMLLGFFAVIFQPVVEETLFRGYFYGVFKGWAGPVASAIFTATLFATIHVNIAALLPLLLFAFALTLAYEWSGSIFVPIGMHMAFNGVQLAIMMWWPQLAQQ